MVTDKFMPVEEFLKNCSELITSYFNMGQNQPFAAFAIQ
jgi:hypothetical protein